MAGTRTDPAAHSVTSPPAAGTGWRHAAVSRLARHLPAAGVGAGLGALALGPGLAPGYLLTYDMVFVPRPPFSAALAGITGGPARAVPSDAAMAVLARLLPADVVQKVILLLIFAAACAGAAALVAAGWQQLGRGTAPRIACLAAGVFYCWNPFVAERLLIGQWALLLGYAGLPWVIRELCTGPVRIRPARLVLTCLPAAVGGFAAMAITGLAMLPTALARGSGRERGRRLATTVIIAGVLSLPWLIPSLLVPVHTDPLGVELFAARADTPFGRPGSLLMLSGIWNTQTVPAGYGGAASAAWLIVVAGALAGFAIPAARRAWPGTWSAGVVGLAVAAIGITGPSRALLTDLVRLSPGFAVLRDGQQFVAALALLEATGFGAGLAWLLSRVARPVRPPSRTASSPRSEPAAVALAIIALVAPVLLLPGLAWGEAGRLRPVEYPADWLAAQRMVDFARAPGDVLLLPWAAYRRYPWNDGEAVYDPWNKLLSREVISNDGLQVGDQELSQESAAAIRMNAILSRPGPLTGRLRADGVRFVIIDAGPLLREPAELVAGRARLPGARPLVVSRDLVLLELPGQA
jgi:hypothetical protein